MFIGTEELTHTYMPGTPYAKKALDKVSFELKQGGFALVIGRSGSGKSTLIQHLNGLLKPTAGRVFFAGQDLSSAGSELLKIRRKIGLVFQMPEELFFSETIFDEVAFAPRNLGLEEKEVEERVIEALGEVGLKAEQFINRHPFQLSAGQKRLVALAAVLSLRPEVLVLDEPTAGLDHRGQKNLFQLLASLNKKRSMTFIICTHQLDQVVALADRILVLEEGRLDMDGSPQEIFTRRKKLSEMGLALPVTVEIMVELAECGLDVRTDIFSLDEARKEINRLRGWRYK
ncbi:MAG: energy-coupling factor transporter ATPase [Bacillota bacterium]